VYGLLGLGSPSELSELHISPDYSKSAREMCREVLEVCDPRFTLNGSRRRQFAEILCQTLEIPEGRSLKIHMSFISLVEEKQTSAANCVVNQRLQVAEVISF
jgi:hypothetical protein